MARKNDKWVMFRNYLCNELNITKEDIRSWIEEAICEQAQEMIHNTYGNLTPKEIVDRAIDNKLWDKRINRSDICNAVAKELATRLEIKVKNGSMETK